MVGSKKATNPTGHKVILFIFKQATPYTLMISNYLTKYFLSDNITVPNMQYFLSQDMIILRYTF